MGSEVQNGKAVIHGILDDGTRMTIGGYASFILDDIDLTHEFDLERLKDETKFTCSLIAADGHMELTINWTPAGTTRTAANATAVFLSPLAKVTLAHFKVAIVNGDWVYVGKSKLKIVQGVAKMSIPLEKYDDATQNTALTTAAS